MGYAFISYSSKNMSSANAILELFKKHNINTWMAPNDIPVGSRYAQVINKALKNCDCLVLLITSDAQNSRWVAKEVERAINYGKIIIPIKLEDIELNDEFDFYLSTDQIIAINKIDDNTEEIKQILSSVKAHTQKHGEDKPFTAPQPTHTDSDAATIEEESSTISVEVTMPNETVEATEEPTISDASTTEEKSSTIAVKVTTSNKTTKATETVIDSIVSDDSITIPENTPVEIETATTGSETITSNNTDIVDADRLTTSIATIYPVGGTFTYTNARDYLANSDKGVLVVPNGYIKLAENAIDGLQIKKIYLPRSLRTIPERFFFGAKSLEGIFMSSHNPVFESSFDGKEIFYKDSHQMIHKINDTKQKDHPKKQNKPEKAIKESSQKKQDDESGLILSEGQKTITKIKFAHRKDIKTLTIPNSVRRISIGAFSDCSELTSIVLSENLKSIGKSAFANCTSLQSVSIPNSVTEIHENAFSGCTALTNIKLSDNTTCIAPYTFQNCKSLKSIHIPYGVTEIEHGAFWGCDNLTEIFIPSSVKKIETCTFAYCKKLKAVILPSEPIEIKSGAFYYCKSLENKDGFIIIDNNLNNTIYEYNGIAENIYIPNNITKINTGVFTSTRIKTITIPNSVINISPNAFKLSPDAYIICERDSCAYQYCKENGIRNSVDITSDGYKEKKLCAYCGGSFTGFIKKKCSVCGKPKDY